MVHTNDEIAAKEARLGKSVQEAECLREFCKHPGFAIMQKMIEEKVADKKNEWLAAKSPEQAEQIRQQTMPWHELFEFLKSRILKGDAASLAIRSLKEDSAQE